LKIAFVGSETMLLPVSVTAAARDRAPLRARAGSIFVDAAVADNGAS
jgi:hypothetical protein